MLRLPKFSYKVPFAKRDTWWSIIYVHTSFMNILGASEVRYRQCTAIWNNFCDTEPEWSTRLTYTVAWGPVTISYALWAQATICDQQKPSAWIPMVVTCQMTVILLFFWSMGGVVGPHGDKMKNWRFYSYGNFGDKNHRFHLPAE